MPSRPLTRANGFHCAQPSKSARIAHTRAAGAPTSTSVWMVLTSAARPPPRSPRRRRCTALPRPWSSCSPCRRRRGYPRPRVQRLVGHHDRLHARAAHLVDGGARPRVGEPGAERRLPAPSPRARPRPRWRRCRAAARSAARTRLEAADGRPCRADDDDGVVRCISHGCASLEVGGGRDVFERMVHARPIRSTAARARARNAMRKKGQPRSVRAPAGRRSAVTGLALGSDAAVGRTASELAGRRAARMGCEPRHAASSKWTWVGTSHRRCLLGQPCHTRATVC